MTTEKTPNYTPETVAAMVKAYESANTDEARKSVIESLANNLGKSVASVRMKLVSEGVYRKAEKVKAEGKSRTTKADVVAEIEEAAGVEAGTFESFEKATMAALKALRDSF